VVNLIRARKAHPPPAKVPPSREDARAPTHPSKLGVRCEGRGNHDASANAGRVGLHQAGRDERALR